MAQGNSGLLFASARNTIAAHQSARCRHTKHWNPKFRKLRAKKFIKVQLPNFNQDLSPEQIRAKMKERGIKPERPWVELPTYVSCMGGIFEEYVPPEGDGKFSVLTTSVSFTRYMHGQDVYKSWKNSYFKKNPLKKYQWSMHARSRSIFTAEYFFPTTDISIQRC